jgi:hypothetical protein
MEINKPKLIQLLADTQQVSLRYAQELPVSARMEPAVTGSWSGKDLLVHKYAP